MCPARVVARHDMSVVGLLALREGFAIHAVLRGFAAGPLPKPHRESAGQAATAGLRANVDAAPDSRTAPS